jgi:hypothetical protein
VQRSYGRFRRAGDKWLYPIDFVRKKMERRVEIEPTSDGWEQLEGRADVWSTSLPRRGVNLTAAYSPTTFSRISISRDFRPTVRSCCRRRRSFSISVLSAVGLLTVLSPV